MREESGEKSRESGVQSLESGKREESGVQSLESEPDSKIRMTPSVNSELCPPTGGLLRRGKQL